jgi:hypothetical protein
MAALETLKRICEALEGAESPYAQHVACQCHIVALSLLEVVKINHEQFGQLALRSIQNNAKGDNK